MSRALAAAAITLLAALSANANMILNGSNELALVGTEIPNWTEVAGTNWTQRSATPTAFDGTYYFFAGVGSGVGSSATLRQNVDVSGLASSIDAGLMTFDFTGYVRTAPDLPLDTSRIFLSFLNAGGSVLDTFDSGEIGSSGAWQQVSHSSPAVPLTRTVRVDLISKMYFNGTNNDGYYDALSLTPILIPEPGTAMLTLLAAVAAVSRRRRVSR